MDGTSCPLSVLLFSINIFSLLKNDLVYDLVEVAFVLVMCLHLEIKLNGDLNLYL